MTTSKPVRAADLIDSYLISLHAKQKTEQGKRRAEALIEAVAGYDRMPNVFTIKRGRRS